MSNSLTTVSIDLSSVSAFLAQAGMPAGAPAPAATAAPSGAPTATPGVTAQPTGGQPVGGTPGGPSAMFLPLMMLGLVVFMVFMTIMSGRKEKKRREALMASIGKGDKISTSAGIIGTITEISETEVVIRSEDARIRLSKSAIAGVLSSSGQKGSGTIEAKEAGKPVGV